MYQYNCLNPIAPIGLNLFSDDILTNPLLILIKLIEKIKQNKTIEHKIMSFFKIITHKLYVKKPKFI